MSEFDARILAHYKAAYSTLFVRVLELEAEKRALVESNAILRDENESLVGLVRAFVRYEIVIPEGSEVRH